MLGTENWESIAKYLNGRSPRACRERWKLFLHPGITNGPWSHDEDNLLIQLFNSYGPKWKKISVFFKGRSECNIKNRWRCHLLPMELNSKIADKDSNSHKEPVSKITIEPQSSFVKDQSPPPIKENIQIMPNENNSIMSQDVIFSEINFEAPTSPPPSPPPSPSLIGDKSANQPVSATLINSEPIDDVFDFDFNPNDLILNDDDLHFQW